jgi:hypothetical protein
MHCSPNQKGHHAMTQSLHWRKASYSTGGNNCVEIADTGAAAYVRDSKHPEQGHLTFTRTELAAFIDAATAGEYDNLA